jgi:CheY-like chemotaxis protein
MSARMRAALPGDTHGVASRTVEIPALCEHGQMRTILVVDDHPTFRATARALLEAEGFVVIGEAEDGESALEAMERLRPEIVLLDVQLPGIDGFEVAARATALGAVPQIVLTSSREASDFGSLIAKDELSGAAMAALLE